MHRPASVMTCRPMPPAPHRHDGACPLDGLSTERLAGEQRRVLPTLDVRVLDVEPEDQIGEAVAIHISRRRAHRSRLSAGVAKADRAWRYRGGIKGTGRQDSHRDLSVALGLILLRKLPGLMSIETTVGIALINSADKT